MKIRTAVIASILITGTLMASLFGVMPLMAATTTSNAQPADKVVASSNSITAAKVSANGTSRNVKLLSAQMKTSTPEDLIISVNMETALYTQVGAKGQNGNTATITNTASDDITVWVTVDGTPIPVSTLNPVPGGSVADNSNVTFDNRVFGISYALPSLNSTNFFNLWISTKSTHGFQWVILNVGAGQHTIEVHAKVSSATTGQAGGASAWAAIGKRMLIVDPTKLANNAVI